MQQTAPPARENLLDAARAYETIAVVDLLATARLPSLYGNLRALNLAEKAGPSPELARCYASVGLVAGLMAQARIADRYFDRALSTARRLEQEYSLAWVLFWKGYYLMGHARWPDADRALTEALELLDRLGDRRWWDQCLLTLGNLHYNRSEFARSLALYSDGYDSAQRRGDLQAQAWSMIAQALVVLMTRGAQASLVALDNLQLWLANSFQPLFDRAAEINTYGIRALAHWRRGNAVAAWETVQSGATLIAATAPYAYYSLTGYAAVAEVGLRLWESAAEHRCAEPQMLARVAHQSCLALRKLARMFPVGQPQARLWTGLEHWLAAHPSQAQHAWQQAEATARRLAMPYEQGLAHYELGRHLARTDARRSVHLHRAEEIFTQLGMADEVTQLPARAGA